jgi:hypothetical protein
MTRRWSNIVTACGMLFAALTITAAPAQGAAFEAPKPRTDEGQYCVMVLDKLQPGEAVSKVVKSACSTDAASVLATCADPLIRIFWDINYGPPGVTYCGNAGPCDASGYGIGYLGSFANQVSSFKVYDTCNFTRLFDYTYYRGETITYVGSRSWVGSTFNDRAESIRVWHG